MEIKIGNLIDLWLAGYFDCGVHGCNCFNNFGKGFAKEVKQKLHGAYEADQKTKYGDKAKLGSFSKYEFEAWNKKLVTIYNGYTQYSYGGGKINCDYKAIRDVFKAINAENDGKIISFPLIGAGLAKGDWKIISAIIDEELTKNTGILVKLK